jgi:ribosomal protein S18 acetylase RimI-like enzyme
MSAAPFTDPSLRVISLKDVSLSGLETLFDEQCDEWLQLLRWDYTGPSRLIRETTRERELPGFCALIDGQLAGFSFYVIEGNRCSIGDIYVSRRWRGAGADGLMAQALLDSVESIPKLRRLESQCVSVGNELVDKLFLERGFHRFERHYMMLNLSAQTEIVADSLQPRAVTDSDIEIRPWSDTDFTRAAQIIHRSYQGEHDSRINSQYNSEEGCAELLSILTDHIWCGTFLPHVSRIAVDPVTGRAIGVLIASRLAPGAGHIGQISVLPNYQGRGLGRRMIKSAATELKGLGFDLVSLAVTGANTGALHLYDSCGFDTVHRFPVFYRERR